MKKEKKKIQKEKPAKRATIKDRMHSGKVKIENNNVILK